MISLLLIHLFLKFLYEKIFFSTVMPCLWIWVVKTSSISYLDTWYRRLLIAFLWRHLTFPKGLNHIECKTKLTIKIKSFLYLICQAKIKRHWDIPWKYGFLVKIIVETQAYETDMLILLNSPVSKAFSKVL